VTIKSHKPLIVKTLKESTGRFKSVEEFADHLISRIEQAEEFLEMYGGSIIVSPAPKEDPVQIASPYKKVAPAADISERLQPQNSAALKDNFTKEEIRGYCDQCLPQKITVQPNGFKEPLRLFRRLENAPGDLNFVRVKYLPQGSDMGAETMIAGTESALDADKIMEEIMTSVTTVMSPNQRRVEPSFAIPPPESLIAGKGDFAANTDEKDGPGDVSDWIQTTKLAQNNPSSLGAQWRAQKQG
jgi:hypothetical protein